MTDGQATGRVRIRRVGAPGDLGWMIMAHGEQYDAEFGWDTSFEALVTRIVADFAESDHDREAGWIAELDGRRVGCVLCVADPDDPGAAKLRILLVDPSARGRGVGAGLVDTCVDFARRAGYSRVNLWTNNVLGAARRIYHSRGFILDTEEPHHSFGHDLIGESWTLALAS
ncbi:MAG: GNAT family N-acetyltransferase [Microlunatus sp.]|nr:GNAT family N-acetyltransferase [Microlunatus sp.]